jgi:hypothetical protein
MIHRHYRDKKVVGVFVRFRAPLDNLDDATSGRDEVCY